MWVREVTWVGRHPVRSAHGDRDAAEGTERGQIVGLVVEDPAELDLERGEPVRRREGAQLPCDPEGLGEGLPHRPAGPKLRREPTNC